MYGFNANLCQIIAYNRGKPIDGSGKTMTLNLRQKGINALTQLPDKHLPVIVDWLEIMAMAKDNPDVEPEELWLLVTGKLKLMLDEMDSAREIGDWRTYLSQQLSTERR
jgi:hypothetical protein